MDEAMRAAAAQTLQEVLERQAFLFVDPVDAADSAESADPSAGPGEVGTAEDPLLAASLRFAGARTGELALAAPLSLAREIAAGILGCDAGDPPAEAGAGDACKETVNIACGHLLTALFGTGPVFDLGIPQVRVLSGDEAGDWIAAPDASAFSVDGAPLFLRFALDGEGGGGGSP